MHSKGKIKGVAFGEFLAWYAGRFDRGAVERAVLAADHGAGQFDVSRRMFGVLPTRWYDAELVHAILDELLAPHDAATRDRMAHDAADSIIDLMVTGLYRTMFGFFVTPDRYARHASKLWQLHYDSGRLVFENLAATAVRVEMSDWYGHHPFICRMNNLAARPVYTAMGCKDVRTQPMRCLSLQGGSSCEYVISWSRSAK